MIHLDFPECNLIKHSILASASSCLYAKSPVRMGEKAFLNDKILNTTCHFASYGHSSMSVFHQTLPDTNVFRRCFILLPHIYFTGLYCNTVISQGETNSGNFNSFAGFRIQSICVWRIAGVFYGKIIEFQIIAEIRVQCPGRAVAKPNSLNCNLFAMIDKKHTGSESPFHYLGLLPPVFLRGIAVDYTFSVNHYILNVNSGYDACKHGERISLPCTETIFFLFIIAFDQCRKFRVIIALCTCKKNGILFNLNSYIAF